jgi:small conductance mechanosensitive channel
MRGCAANSSGVVRGVVGRGGVAIGVAWGGLLTNFAAGHSSSSCSIQGGDFISPGGVPGTVDSIGLFGTTINTPDNVLTIVGTTKSPPMRSRITRRMRIAA